MPLLTVLFGVYVLPETCSFGFFGSGYASVLCALFGSTADTVHVSAFGGFWYNFTSFSTRWWTRAVFPSVVVRPWMLASWSVWTRRTVMTGDTGSACRHWHFHGWFCGVRCISRCVPLFVGRPSLDCWEIFVFSAMLGSSEDMVFAAVYGHLFGAVCC